MKEIAAVANIEQERLFGNGVDLFKNYYAVLGICNILEKAGNDVVRANYLGDIGLHVIKWMWCYLKYHNGEEPGEDITRWMGDIYAESDRRHHDEPEADAEIRALFARWDRRDQDVVDL